MAPPRVDGTGTGRRWITISAAATYLGIHPQTAYSWAARKLLPTARIGGALRVDLRALEQDLERQAAGGALRRRADGRRR